MSRDDLSRAYAIVEVALPIPVTHAWIAFACQKGGLTRPRWDVERRVWTTRGVGGLGETETITISTPGGPRTLRVVAEWARDDDLPALRETSTVRRLVSSLLTGMFQRARTAAARK